MTRLQRMSLLGLAAVGSLMANVAMAASSLQDLNFTALGGDRMELKLDFVGGVPEVKGYRIETPPRITIDLLDTSSQLDKRRFDLGLSGVDELVALEAATSGFKLCRPLFRTAPEAAASRFGTCRPPFS